MMKKLLFTLITTVAITFSTSIIANVNNTNLVATVNGSFAISNYDISQKIKFLNVINNTNLSFENKQAKETVLNNIVATFLLNQEAKKFGITINAMEIKNAIENMGKDSGISEHALQRKAQSLGLSTSTFNRLLREELLAEKVKQSLSYSGLRVSNTEIDEELSRLLSLNGKMEFHLFEIVISTVDTNPDYAKKRIDEAYNELQGGIPLLTVSNKYNRNLFHKSNGEIGWVPQDYIPKEVQEEIIKVGNNKPTKPLLLGNDYKIFITKEVRPLLEINPSSHQHMEQLKDFARQKLTHEKSQIALEDYMQNLFKGASIHIYGK